MIRNRFFTSCALIFFLLSDISAEESESQKKYIKGNIYDKTAAVREASGAESEILSRWAIDFSLRNREILGNDRDLGALAVAGILSLPKDYIASSEQNVRDAMMQKFIAVFTAFNDENVRSAVINKVSVLRDYYAVNPFADTLNTYLSKNVVTADSEQGVVKDAIVALGLIGNSNSFDVLNNAYRQKKWQQYENELTVSMGQIADKALSEILGIIQEGNIQNIREIFNVLVKNEKNSSTFRAQIAENTLSQTIYIAGNSATVTRETVNLQMDSLRVLVQLKWTRAASTVLSFFETARWEYGAQSMKEDEYVEVIGSLAVIAPVDAAQTLSSYLAELNKQAENGTFPAENVVLAVINTLGAVGDKSAFDSLLYVTYLSYPENVITASRDALKKLKW